MSQALYRMAKSLRVFILREAFFYRLYIGKVQDSIYDSVEMIIKSSYKIAI